MMVDVSRMIVCCLLLAAGCGKPSARPDAPGGAIDGPSGPTGPTDGPGGDSPGGSTDAPGPTDARPTDAPGPADAHPADAPGPTDARPADAPGPTDARPADAPAPTDARMVDAGSLDATPQPPGTPSLGAHAMNFYHLAMSNATSITTPSITTQPSGSTIVVAVGRGDSTLFALPTDNKGNSPYRLQGMHPYGPPFQASGTALYQFTSAIGGSGFQVSTTTGPDHVTGQNDEITLAAIEVVNGTQIQQVWNLVVQQNPPIPVTSASITTTGPATLIAFWFGDAFPGTPQSATPNNGFVVIDTNAQETDSFVQCAVAAKNVTAAGTYNVTWTSTPVQGAQLWLVAVQ